MSLTQRIRRKSLQKKIMSAQEACQYIQHGDRVGMSGFTGSGYPKAIPEALANQIKTHHDQGKPFQIDLWTGASTAPELDGVLAKVNGIRARLPYQSDPTQRNSINQGQIHYMDIHLSHVAPQARAGFFGKLNVAVIEAIGITEEGYIIPSGSVGNSNVFIELADYVIIEINESMNPKMEGMHDIYYGEGIALPPHRQAIPLTKTDDRIGVPYLICPEEKIIAIVPTHAHDRTNHFNPPDETSQKIAQHILHFLEKEVKQGRLPNTLLPLQSGVGNVANAVLAGLNQSHFEHMTAFTEVLQDGMLMMLKSGKIDTVSATAFSLSPKGYEEFNEHIDFYRERIILRPQEISNHPELIKRLGVIAMNSMIEADIYGNINSTHIMGSKIMNGIGGSGDFARNAYLTFFVSPSTAKNGQISAIVPMVSHVDHTEHDVHFIVTEYGLADLRGKSPRERAELIIEQCVHPDFKPTLRNYLNNASQSNRDLHTPHILKEALSFHQKFEKEGHM